MTILVVIVSVAVFVVAATIVAWPIVRGDRVPDPDASAAGQDLKRVDDDLQRTLASIKEIDRWAKDNIDQAANELSPAVGIPAPILKLALSRQSWGAQPISPEVVNDQQKIADAFYGLGLIPKPIKVGDVVRGGGS